MTIIIRTPWHTDDGRADIEVEFTFEGLRPEMGDIDITRAWWVAMDRTLTEFTDAEIAPVLASAHVREACRDVAADRVMGR